MNILKFKGMGYTENREDKTDLNNCRIRANLISNKGRKIFLEISGIEVTETTRESLKRNGIGQIIGYIDHCFYTDRKADLQNQISTEFRKYEKKYNFKYNKEYLLKFINHELDCNYDDIEII